LISTFKSWTCETYNRFETWFNCHECTINYSWFTSNYSNQQIFFHYFGQLLDI